MTESKTLLSKSICADIALLPGCPPVSNMHMIYFIKLNRDISGAVGPNAHRTATALSIVCVVVGVIIFHHAIGDACHHHAIATDGHARRAANVEHLVAPPNEVPHGRAAGDVHAGLD